MGPFISVATANQQVCQSVGAITLTSPSGYLANAITDATGVGSTSCPWKISMSPGQRINITLYDFSRPLLTEKRNINSRSSPCVRYAIIREQTMSVHNIPICGEKRRIRPVYISTGSTVDVSITRRSNQQFVLEYKGESFTGQNMIKLEIAQSEQDVSHFCKESDMTYS